MYENVPLDVLGLRCRRASGTDILAKVRLEIGHQQVEFEGWVKRDGGGGREALHRGRGDDDPAEACGFTNVKGQIFEIGHLGNNVKGRGQE